MTIQELLNWCDANNVPLNTTHIVLSHKDEHLLIEDNVRIDTEPYFGNCTYGEALLDKIAPRNEETDEREISPQFLFLSTGY